MKVKTILVSQPAPKAAQSPYFDLMNKQWKINDYDLKHYLYSNKHLSIDESVRTKYSCTPRSVGCM